jgi:hypothetical protein
MPQSREIAITRFDGHTSGDTRDCVALEEPVEIRVDAFDGAERGTRSLSITMRTPGQDHELAADFRLTEGLLHHAHEIGSITQDSTDVVTAHLADHARVAWPTMERHFYGTSSCGVCGKSSLDALEVPGLQRIARDRFSCRVQTVPLLSDRLRARQSVFDQTGGLHAAALFDGDGAFVDIRHQFCPQQCRLSVYLEHQRLCSTLHRTLEAGEHKSVFFCIRSINSKCVWQPLGTLDQKTAGNRTFETEPIPAAANVLPICIQLYLTLR